jgi:hypothetical protein
MFRVREQTSAAPAVLFSALVLFQLLSELVNGKPV